MPFFKVVELMTESDRSWDDATRIAVDKTTATQRGICSISIKNLQVKIEDNKMTRFRVNTRVLFWIDENENAALLGI